DRYLANGTPDPSFAISGTNSIPSHLGNAAVLADGTLIGLGLTYATYAPRTDPRNRPSTFDAVVVDSAGSIDAALASNFLAQMIRCSPSGTAVPGTPGLPVIVVTPDDQIILGYGACMLRLNRDASLDMSFGANGVSSIDNGGLSIAQALRLKDGSV